MPNRDCPSRSLLEHAATPAPWTAPRRFRKSGFTLVELIVVIGIIAALVGILLPVATKARESSMRLACAANLHQLGEFIMIFAGDHNGRVPEGQDTPQMTAGSKSTTWMYTKDYFVLVDYYKADQRLFICPFTPLAQTGPSGFPYGEGNELNARADLDDLPDNPVPVSQGDPDLFIYWVGTDYQYMGRNIQETLLPGENQDDGAPFEVTKLDRNTHTGTSIDTNPPLMADRCTYLPNTGYLFNHGRSWNIPSFDPTPSTYPWYTGTASAHFGDVRVNVLYRDGHVEDKVPDLHAYHSYLNLSYSFR
jgi:prepilin-type N-terminal cleavage/methylation domain-containing protein